MLHVLVYSCRLQFVSKVINNLRVIYDPSSSTPFWFMDVKPLGTDIIVRWGGEALRFGEATLLALLKTDANLLRSSPDIIFSMTLFAVGLVLGFRFFVFKNVGVKVPGYTDDILSKLLVHLSAAASDAPEHPAQRCAEMIKIMASTWQSTENGEEDTQLQSIIPPFVTVHPQAALPNNPFMRHHKDTKPTPRFSENTPLPDLFAELGICSMIDPEWTIPSDIFQDNELWAQLGLGI